MSTVRIRRDRDGQLARVTLARPKANLLDAEMIASLAETIAGLDPEGPLKLVVIDAEGPHFSFGASVQEHLPDQVGAMLGDFHRLFREIEDLGVPTAAIVRGQCLGGGLELAVACGQVFCDPSARMGVPEIQLGVFPPVAAVLLPLRLRGADALRLVLSGEAMDGQRAAALGLADACDDDPEAACLAWFDAALAPKSAVAVRCAWRAVRRPVRRALYEDLPAVERLYLQDLMSNRDPVEGLNAFLERRPPQWEHR